MPILAKKSRCTGCMLCKEVCPKGAIEIMYKDGFRYPHVNKHRCIDCKLCEKYCPIVSTKILTSDIKETLPYSVKSKDDNRRIKSASGGFFVELATFFFERYKERCHVVGACLDRLKVNHIIVNKQSDLYLLQGTKYMSSKIDGVYTSVYQLLQKGDFVLFTGLPCQAYALKKYLNGKAYKGELVICDLICNGVPSRKLLEIDIKNNLHNINKIISFRDKVNGWKDCLAFTYETTDKHVVRLDCKDSFFLNAFKVNYALRDSCYQCPYCTIERTSDFTIGDYWGGNHPLDDQKKGVSLVLCHNENAKKILADIPTINWNRVSWQNCLPYNPRIYCGRRFVQWVIPRMILNVIWHCSYNIQNQILTNNLGIISKRRYYWVPLKIWQILILKIENHYRLDKLKNTLRTYRDS